MVGGGNYALEYGPSLTTWMQLDQLGGGIVDPSPTVIEIGAHAAAVPASAATVEVIFLGP